MAPTQGHGETASTALPSISEERREAIRQSLIGPLSAMTGFAALSEPDRREAGRFWIEALAEYEPEEIRAAFRAFTRTGNKYPNPQAIVALILDARKLRAVKPVQDRAAYWADQINAGRPISRFSVTPTLCEEMAERGLVSRDILRERGLG